MASYTVTHKQVTENIGVLTLLTENEIVPGASITISGMGAPWDGARTVTRCPQYLLVGLDDYDDAVYDFSYPIIHQVQFALTTDNVTRTAATGTVTYTPTCSWVSVGDVEDWLGFTVTNPSSDYALLNMAVGAGNQFAWRRRQEAGYFDSLTTVPSTDVKLGTVMYCGYLYRMRGSASESYAAYDPLATSGPIGGSFVEVLRLLGINRPQVA